MFIRFFIKMVLRVDNFIYYLLSFLAVKAEKGRHPKHRLIGYHQFFLNNIKAGERVLDIGCGQGFLSFSIAQKAKEVIGIDINKKNIAQASKKFALPNLKFVLGDILKYNFEDKFDVLVLSNVLEHIKERTDFLKRLSGFASKILIRVPLLERDWLTLYKKELGVEYRLDKGHFIEYTFSSFKKELLESGWEISHSLTLFGELWVVAFCRE
ncbi:class I SAM-dependent methyltransferase [Candidatus Parcubacteria bacterium]|nr:class I SAM-dependent methyltransferase [Candidatus Parcubacteria bacterium]